MQVDVVNRSAAVDLANYVLNGEWELLTVGVQRNEIIYACCVEPYPDVTFTIVIRRRTLYYLFNVIFPCLWLSVLSLVGFVLLAVRRFVYLCCFPGCLQCFDAVGWAAVRTSGQ